MAESALNFCAELSKTRPRDNSILPWHENTGDVCASVANAMTGDYGIFIAFGFCEYELRAKELKKLLLPTNAES